MKQDSSEGRPSDYLDRLMRRESFQVLWPLFSHATRPAKEMTESFSALVHLRPYFPKSGPFRVIHVGDGAHARTAALFALKTRGENLSVDPQCNLALVAKWTQRYGIERVEARRSRVEELYEELSARAPVPTFITFVHAHVSVDRVLSELDFEAAFTLACCVPGKQLSKQFQIASEGRDTSVICEDRQYQVLLPARTGDARSPSGGTVKIA